MSNILSNRKSFYKKIFKTVVEAQDFSGASHTYIMVEELDTLYSYYDNAPTYIVDGTKVLSTAKGGNSRWVGIAGQYSNFGSSDTPIWIGTYSELKALVSSDSLAPLGYYIINDYQTIHKLVEVNTTLLNINVVTIPTESLLLKALTVNTFDVTATSMDYSYEEGDYDFFDDYVYETDYYGEISWSPSGGSTGTIGVTRLSATSFSTDKRIGNHLSGFNLDADDGTNNISMDANNEGIDYTVVHGIDSSVFTFISPMDLNSPSASLFQEEYVPYGIQYRKGYLKNRRNLKKKYYDICDYRSVIAARYPIYHDSVPLWSNATTYSKDTLVRQGNSLFACLLDGCLNQQPGLTGGSYFWIRVSLSGYTDPYKYCAYRENTSMNLGDYSLPVDTSDVRYCFRLCNPNGTQISEGEFQAEDTCKNLTIKETSSYSMLDSIDASIFYKPSAVKNSEFSGYGMTFVYNISNSKIENGYGCLIARSTDSEIIGNAHSYHDDAQDSKIYNAVSCIFTQTVEVTFNGGYASRIYILRYSNIGSKFSNNNMPRTNLNSTIAINVTNNHLNNIDGCIIDQGFANNTIGAESYNCRFGANITNISLAFGAPSLVGIDITRSSATTAQRLAAPVVEGVRIWDTDLKKYFIYNGTAWVEVVGIEEAPINGNTYARKDGTWVNTFDTRVWRTESFVITATNISDGFVSLTLGIEYSLVFLNGIKEGSNFYTTSGTRINFVDSVGDLIIGDILEVSYLSVP